MFKNKAQNLKFQSPEVDRSNALEDILRSKLSPLESNSDELNNLIKLARKFNIYIFSEYVPNCYKSYYN